MLASLNSTFGVMNVSIPKAASNTRLAVHCIRICGVADILRRRCGSPRGARMGIPSARSGNTTTERKDYLPPAPYSYHSLALASSLLKSQSAEHGVPAEPPAIMLPESR